MAVYNSSHTGNEVDLGINKAHEHSNEAILDATEASFLTADETKLDNIEAGAEVNVIDTAGTLLDLSGTTLNVDLEELTTKTTNPSYFYCNSSGQARVHILKIFAGSMDNNLGWTSNAGTVTSISAGTGMAFSTITSTGSNEKLKSLDIEWQKETEQGNINNALNIATKKQYLRDIPDTFDLTVAKTPKELKAMMPEDLSS